jgi:hypothetical protein
MMSIKKAKKNRIARPVRAVKGGLCGVFTIDEDGALSVEGWLFGGQSGDYDVEIAQVVGGEPTRLVINLCEPHGEVDYPYDEDEEEAQAAAG